jgi:hypothetical protein
MMTTLKIYSLCNFQVHNILLFTVVTMIYNKSVELIPSFKRDHMVFFFLYLAYFNYQNVLQFHLSCHKWQNFLLFKAEWHSTVCVCVCVCVFHSFFIQSSADGHLGGSNFIPSVNNTTIDTGAQPFLWNINFISFKYIHINCVAGSYGKSIFNIFKNLHINLYSHEHCTRLHFSTHLCQHFFAIFCVFFNNSHFDRCEVVSSGGSN